MSCIVSGMNGQLGRDVRANVSHNGLVSCDRLILDITNEKSLRNWFGHISPDYFLNCAAYTQVDHAEEDQDKCNQINGDCLKFICELCNEFNVTLIHISTDYVFDGEKTTPYLETDETNPQGVYGESKLKGEQIIQDNCEKYVILRTSWLYSKVGNNFVNTMLRLSEDRDEINVVSDQYGSPTWVREVSKVIQKILDNPTENGIYHISNEGNCSWSEFAEEIFRLKGIDTKVNPIGTKDYKTLAKRPKYSVLDCNKIKTELNIDIPNWKESLKECL
jgi:dTDP-4-dehydrorhamnose reductase|tara:strand:+ start:17018 stop:17845 length:828 start_codon:yes stop_codon:yes gene_type:complete